MRARHQKPRIFKVLAALSLLIGANSCDAPTPTHAADPWHTATDSGEIYGAPIKLQLRWGGGEPVGGPSRWDGDLHLDCGRITDLRFTGAERDEGDGLGVGQRDERGTNVRWRSTVDGDRDGVEATIIPCVGEAGSTLQVTTPGRQWRARLQWSRDEFVSLPVGDAGERLEIRLRAVETNGPNG